MISKLIKNSSSPTPDSSQGHPLNEGDNPRGIYPPHGGGMSADADKGEVSGLKNIFSFSLLIFSLLLIAACKTTDQNEPMPPVISLKSLSKDTLVQFADSLNITIRYSDVNGDLGSSDPDNNTLYIKDSRLDSADYYHVKPLSPPNSNIKIQGELTVKVRNMFLLGNGGNESAYFTIKLRDQSGQWSNEVITTPVVITQ